MGVSKLALQMGGENLWSFYRQLGLGGPVGLGLQGENGGKVAVANNRWGPLETATLSYGYGLAITPLQLAQAYQVLANDGIKQPLTLLRRQPSEFTQGKQVLPKAIANDVVKMLQTVVGPKGTARRAKVDGYLVAGKTGTVHKVGSEGYKDESYLALFAGIAPADDPKVVTIVVIDEPSGREYYGGEVAAPIYSRVMQSSLRLMNVLPSESIENIALGGLL